MRYANTLKKYRTPVDSPTLVLSAVLVRFYVVTDQRGVLSMIEFQDRAILL